MQSLFCNLVGDCFFLSLACSTFYNLLFMVDCILLAQLNKRESILFQIMDLVATLKSRFFFLLRILANFF